MMTWTILESISGDWYMTAYSDGSVLVEHRTLTQSWWLSWNMSVADSGLMTRPAKMVYDFRNTYRNHFRLSIYYRAGTYGVWKQPKRRFNRSIKGESKWNGQQL